MDKDASILWLQVAPMMASRWTSQLSNAVDRWAIVDLPASSLVAWCRRLFDNCLPRLFLGKDTRLSLQHVPSMYPTVTRKCYSNVAKFVVFAGRAYACTYMYTCTKSNHSCFRNIISFSNILGRLGMKQVLKIACLFDYTLSGRLGCERAGNYSRGL